MSPIDPITLNAAKPVRPRLQPSLKIEVGDAIRHAGLALAVGLGCVFFYPIFETWSFLLPLAAMLAICTAIALAVRGSGLATAPSLLVVLVGAIAVLPGLSHMPSASLGLPFPRALGELASGIANGPAEMLTLPVPVEATQSLLLVPLGIALLSFLLGIGFLHSSRPRLSMAGPVLSIVGSLSFGPRGREFVRVGAAMFLAAALLYLIALDRTTRRKSLLSKSRRALPIGSAAFLMATIGFAVLVGPTLPFVRDRDRFTLRTYRQLPFDPTSLTSPLSEYSYFGTPVHENQIFFSATGELPKRWRLATLDAYDGETWAVGNADANGEGLFQLVGARLRRASEITVGKIRVANVTLQKGWRDPWLPMPGPGVDIEISSKLQRSLRYNRNGEVMALLDLSKPNVSYRIDWLDVKDPPQSVIAAAQPDFTGGLGRLDNAPAIISKRAQEFTAGATTPYLKAKALEARLKDGFFSGAASPGHEIGRLSKMLQTAKSMQGNGEQYAALFGVLARSLGLPVRVVVGFEPPEQRVGGRSDVRGGDIIAWDEVNLVGVGWTRFDPIPEKTRSPKIESSKPLSDLDKKTTPPKPATRPDQNVLSEKTKQSKQKEVKKNNRLTWLRPVLIGAGIVITPFLMFGLVLGLVAGLKARRRKKRRRATDPARRVSGAWDELIDRARDTRLVEGQGTLLETAAATPQLPTTAREHLQTAALIADRAAFHPVAPTDDEATATWQLVDSFRRSLNEGASKWERLRRTLSLRTLATRR